MGDLSRWGADAKREAASRVSGRLVLEGYVIVASASFFEGIQEDIFQYLGVIVPAIPLPSTPHQESTHFKFPVDLVVLRRGHCS